MGLRFVCGRAGTGKSSLCLAEVSQELRRKPWGPPLIILVPEQATYQMDEVLANVPDLGGSMRAQVLSFQRLAWRVFAETGGGHKVRIGGMGKRMILQRILLQQRQQLKAFAHSAVRPGVTDLFAQAIGEFKIYRIAVKDLRKVKKAHERLRAKLQDLALIYEEFQGALGERIRDPDDELTILAEKIPTAPLLKGAKVWVDGFTGFTPQELEVLKVVLATAEEVVVTCSLDPSFLTVDNQVAAEPFAAGESFFAGPWRTYQELQRLALETGVLLQSPVFLKETRRYRHPWLRHLEKCFFRYPTVPYVTEQEDLLAGGIEIFSAVSKRAEVEGVARELRRLARDEGFCWREMSVLTRDLTDYHELIDQVFTAYEIDYFLDAKRSVLHHPLLELIQAIQETAERNFAYEPLFRCLKTDFFPLPRDTIDRLENYVLEYGIGGESWEKNSEWDYQRQGSWRRQESQLAVEAAIQTEVNDARKKIYEILSPFVQAFGPDQRNALPTGREISEALYACLERLDVPEKLQQWSQMAQAEGDLGRAKLNEQIWEAVLQVLDEIVVSLGDAYLTLEEYRIILASGLESIQLGLVPPGLDQVLVGSLDRSRNPEVRVLFLLGANEGVLPLRSDFEGLFDSEERELLEKEGVALAPKGRAQLFEEQFYIYTALTRAVEKLVVSYPLTDEEGKGLTVSPVVTRLTEIFPLPQECWGAQEEIAKISQKDFAFQAYAEELQTLRQGERLSPLWQAVAIWLAQDGRYREEIKWLHSGLASRNQEGKLDRPLARRLYGKRLQVSVSRLEQFAKCPFGHYAQYGLKLKERPIYQLSSLDRGDFFHVLLRHFALRLQEQGLEWGRLTREESWALVSELTEQLAPDLQHKILLSSARHRYLTHKLKRTVHHAVRVLGEHARRGQFIPIQLEVGFGPEEVLPGVEVPLAEGSSLLLAGQIDRIDAAFLDGKVYLRILDYKSRELSLALDSIYHGLNLQLLTYLDVALQGAEVLFKNSSMQKLPAGFLYFPVLEPQLEEKAPLSSEMLEQQRLKAVKVRGYLLAEPRVLEAMDVSFGTGQSDLLGLKLKKDGTFAKGANVLTEEQFAILRGYLHQRLAQTGEEILNGDISLSPYRRGKDTGCTYCSYKPVCHFDPYLPENRYRNLPALKPEEVWRRLNE